MYTPAQEVGLLGQKLATRVQRALDALSPSEMAALMRSIQRTAGDRHLAYQRDGETEIIRLLPCPLTIRSDQLGYTHYVCETILNCTKRLPDAYFEIAEVRDILRLTPIEEEWLRECWTPAHRDANPVFARLDAAADYTIPAWKDSIKFMEPNLAAIGGLHIGPTAMSILADIVVPALLAHDPTIRLQRPDDIRELLLQELFEHLEVIGRPEGNIVLVDPKYEKEGPDEPEELAAYYRKRHGVSVEHADVSELYLKNGEVYYGDTRVDVVYRDASVIDLMDYKDEGADIEPMRVLLRENRAISSIAAELDQKSCFEIFTDPGLAERLLTVEERHVMRRHVLWTRILSERRTLSPRSDDVDLLEYARVERETLVLKPNRAYGGEGVVVGHNTTQGEWESSIEAALHDEERWVVQQAAQIPTKAFHVMDNNVVHSEPFYYVMGFAPTRYGVALVVRASQRNVVNVAQRGGMCGVMVSAKALTPSAPASAESYSR